jgi:hypothetical protein
MTLQLTDVRPSTSWFIQMAIFGFVTLCTVTVGCQYYGGTCCLQIRGLRNRFETDVITGMMELLHWQVMKKGSRNLSSLIDTLAPLK